MPTPSDRSLSRTSIILLIVVASFLVYGRSLTFGFINYDDYELVRDNGSFLQHLPNIFTSFTTHAFTTHRAASFYYRPLLLVSYILDYQLWALHPSGYHVTNIFLHCLAGIALFLLLEFLTRSKAAALFGSLLFVLHPIQTESVAWIAGRNDILLGLFILLMIYFYAQRYDHPERGGVYIFLTAAAFTMALFTKESAAFYLLLLPSYDLIVRHMPVRRLLAFSNVVKFLIFALVLGCYLLVRLSIFKTVIGAESLYGFVPFPIRVKLIPAMLSEHITFLLFPAHLSIEHPLNGMIWLQRPWSILALVIMLVFALAIWWSWRRDSILCFGLAWLAVGLIPAMNIIPVAVPILEHRLYLPLVGLVIVAGRLATRFATSARISWIPRAAMIVLLAAAGIGAFLRTAVWQNSETLWADAVEKAPTSSRAYFNLADYLYQSQQFEKTIDLLQRYIALKPQDPQGYTSLEQTYLLLGAYSNASETCHRLIAQDPKNPQRYIDAAAIYEKFNLLDSAASICKQGLASDSGSYQLHLKVGSLDESLGRFAEAETHFRQAIRIQPQSSEPYYRLGLVIAKKGDDQAAKKSINEGVIRGAAPQDLSYRIQQLMEESQTADTVHERMSTTKADDDTSNLK